jgi:hypothetical protein
MRKDRCEALSRFDTSGISKRDENCLRQVRRITYRHLFGTTRFDSPLYCRAVTPPHLLVSVFALLNVEELELIGVLVCRNNIEKITNIVLLQELLREVLQVALGESNVSLDDNLALVQRNIDRVAKVLGLAIDLDLLLEKSLLTKLGRRDIIANKGRGCHNTVTNANSAVDDKLVADLLLGNTGLLHSEFLQN